MLTHLPHSVLSRVIDLCPPPSILALLSASASLRQAIVLACPSSVYARHAHRHTPLISRHLPDDDDGGGGDDAIHSNSSFLENGATRIPWHVHLAREQDFRKQHGHRWRAPLVGVIPTDTVDAHTIIAQLANAIMARAYAETVATNVERSNNRNSGNNNNSSSSSSTTTTTTTTSNARLCAARSLAAKAAASAFCADKPPTTETRKHGCGTVATIKARDRSSTKQRTVALDALVDVNCFEGEQRVTQAAEVLYTRLIGDHLAGAGEHGTTPCTLVVPVDGAPSTEQLALALLVRTTAHSMRCAVNINGLVASVAAYDLLPGNETPVALLDAVLHQPQPDERLTLASVGANASSGARAVRCAMELASWLERIPSLTSSRVDNVVRVIRVALEWKMSGAPSPSPGTSREVDVASTGIVLLLTDTMTQARDLVVSGNDSYHPALASLAPGACKNAPAVLLPLRRFASDAIMAPYAGAEAAFDLSVHMTNARAPPAGDMGPRTSRRSVYQPVPMVASALFS